MKSIHEHIEVNVRPGGRVPRRFRWDQRTYRVHRLLDYWILQTRWWGREEKRIYYRLETNRGIVEIYRAAEIVRSAARYAASRYTASCSAAAPPDSASDTLRFTSDGADSAAACRTAPRRSAEGGRNTPADQSTESFLSNPADQSVEGLRGNPARQSAESSTRAAHRSVGAGANPLPDPRADRPPLPIEGDTHTRERRRTDAAYRPDVRIEERARRQAAAEKASGTEHRVRWVLSKILD